MRDRCGAAALLEEALIRQGAGRLRYVRFRGLTGRPRRGILTVKIGPEAAVRSRLTPSYPR
jgi:hypothetical protein